MSLVEIPGATSKVGVGVDNPADTMEIRGVTGNGAGIRMGKLFAGWNSMYLNGLTGDNYNFIGQNSTNRLLVNRPTGHSIIWQIGGTTVATLASGGNMNATSTSKGAGTFRIPHPILEGKDLIHSFIEGPKVDLIYRGEVQLVDGYASVNLDSDCTSREQGMTPGTFEELARNPSVFLHNSDSFDRVRGKVTSNILEIWCQNESSTDVITWMVIVERKDSVIKAWDKADDDGYMILEVDADPALPIDLEN